MATTDRTDVIVVGSGAGGAAAALKLVEAGRRVLMLEKCGFLPRDRSTLDVKQVFKEGRFKNHEPWVDGYNKTFIPGEYYNVGGKTKWYGAALLRFSPHEFGADPLYGVRYLGAVAGLVLLGELTVLFSGGRGQAPPPPDGFGSVQMVGRSLFGEYLLPFELTSILLLAAALAVIVVARSKTPNEAEEA